MPWLINAAQADKFRKSQKSLIIFDASFHLPEENRNAAQEFSDKHILGAHFFDVKAFSDSQGNFPHQLITDEKKLSDKLGQMGIRNDYKIIFYDNSSLHTACRAVWMMKYFGHNPNLLYVLDGGLAAWEKSSRKTEAGENTISPKKYNATLQPHLVRTLQQIKANLLEYPEQVIDVRHALRYSGGPETRAGLRTGHIPGSHSFPYTSFFDKNNYFLPLEKIHKLLTSVAIDLKNPIIATCGGSTTACILDFLLDVLNHKQHAVYEGSWTEWAAEKLYPGEKSLAERPVKMSNEHDDPPKIK